MKIITYVPRDSAGRFANFNLRGKMKKVLVCELILLSLVMNVWLARQLYVVHCSAGGMFMTQAKCGELAENQFDSQELARVQMLAANPDLR